tara:strand:+ start:735 stop:1262 length:528 start_codon:yes stop_codon:yes gene_type:complete
MKLYSSDIRFNSVSNLERIKYIDDTTYTYFKDFQLPQDNTKIWRYGVLENYKQVYVGILTNDKIKFNYFEDATYASRVIVSFMVMIKIRGHPFRFIDLIDTYMPKNDLALKMIHAYVKQYRKKVIPCHIIPTSIDFWKKYIRTSFQLETIDEYEHFIELHQLENHISWNHLLDTL